MILGSDGVNDDFFVLWYKRNGRDFPWRLPTVSSFQLLITEMLLRQTRAVQVERLWDGFMSSFGSPSSLVEAPSKAIFDAVEELGFGNQRTKALKAAATHLVEEHGGELPNSEEDLLAIPHVGLYTARAVRCFAYGEPVPVVDTNIVRLFCRLTGRSVKRPDVRRINWVWEEASALLSRENPAAHNYGLLDFNAQVCLPRKPKCAECPLADDCEYGQAVLKGAEPVEPW